MYNKRFVCYKVIYKNIKYTHKIQVRIFRIIKIDYVMRNNHAHNNIIVVNGWYAYCSNGNACFAACAFVFVWYV